MGLRLTIGTILSILTAVIIIHFAQLPADRYLPPNFSVHNISMKASGEVISTAESPYTEHFWEANTDTEYYINYQFHPSIAVIQPDGKIRYEVQQAWQTGSVKGVQSDLKDMPAGKQVQISYDPYNPLINGLAGTGKINMKANFFSGWLFYLIGFIVLVLLYERLMRVWLKNDTD